MFPFNPKKSERMNSKPMQKAREAVNAYRSAADSPDGSYTGVTNKNEPPVQDSDDV